MTTKHPDVMPYPESFMASHRQGRLSSAITARAISARLGMPSKGASGDGKATHDWQFVFDGNECAIWDYKGTRWSYYGPRAVFESLFPGNVME